jgi:hypothetical protein
LGRSADGLGSLDTTRTTFRMLTTSCRASVGRVYSTCSVPAFRTGFKLKKCRRPRHHLPDVLYGNGRTDDGESPSLHPFASSRSSIQTEFSDVSYDISQLDNYGNPSSPAALSATPVPKQKMTLTRKVYGSHMLWHCPHSRPRQGKPGPGLPSPTQAIRSLSYTFTRVRSATALSDMKARDGLSNNGRHKSITKHPHLKPTFILSTGALARS